MLTRLVLIYTQMYNVPFKCLAISILKGKLVHYANKANAATATAIELNVYFIPLFCLEWEGVYSGIYPLISSETCLKSARKHKYFLYKTCAGEHINQASIMNSSDFFLSVNSPFLLFNLFAQAQIILIAA